MRDGGQTVHQARQEEWWKPSLAAKMAHDAAKGLAAMHEKHVIHCALASIPLISSCFHSARHLWLPLIVDMVCQIR